MLLELRSAHHVHDPSRVCMTCQTRELLTFCMHVAQGRPEVRIVRPESSIKIADVQALLLWVLSEGQNPAWAFVKVSGNSISRRLGNPGSYLPFCGGGRSIRNICIALSAPPHIERKQGTGVMSQVTCSIFRSLINLLSWSMPSV